MSVRTLPIRVEPVAAESIQSWLRMLAYRNDVTWTQILSAVGLHHRRGDGRRTRWSQRLHSHEVIAVALATGVEPAVLQAMTLSVFEGIGVTTGRRPARPDYGALHGLRSRARYCPRCLADSGGRWQLRWHLGYTFVCCVHRVVLADTCPGCGHPPHPRLPTALAVPQPLQCEYRLRREGRVTSCGTDLTSGQVRQAPAATASMLVAQQVIDDVIDERCARFGVYARHPVGARAALNDLRALATRIDRHATGSGTDPEAASPTVPAGLAGSSAFRTAAALTRAVDVLSAGDAAQAGQRLQPLIAATRHGGRTASVSSITNSRRCTTAMLTAVHLHAMAPWLNPTDLLRYRIAQQPQIPRRPAGTLARSVTALPALLWPEIALRLCDPGAELRAVQAAMAVSVALVGTRQPLGVITELLGGAITGRAVSHVWSQMRASDGWQAIQLAVIRLADYLHQHATPIDYRRRRALDYTDLLPDATWQRICRTTDTPVGRPALAAVARTVLFARITGSPTEQAPWFTAVPGFRGQLAQFRSHTTPLLRQQLDTVATEFLADHHITEPLLWSPPAALLADLPLPGPHIDTVDINRLHHLLTRPGTTVTAAARHLQISPDVVRYLSDIYPCPPRPQTVRRNQMRRIPGLTATTLTRSRCLGDANLTALARQHNLSRQTLARIATAVGVAPHAGARPPRCRRNWLEQRYLVDRQTMAEVAAASGVSPTTVARWLRYYRITARPRGARSHSSSGAAHRNAATYPALLRPALADPCGWNRLQRFAAAMQHATLSAAAQHLNTSQPVLSQQLNRLENQFGRPLYHRAQRGQPLRPSVFGRRVISALATMAPDADSAAGSAASNTMGR